MDTTKTVFEGLALVREKITRGGIPPGSRITEALVSELSGISRTPAREVIRILTVQGVLESSPNKGAVVRVITPDEVTQIYETRLLLEPYVAKRALSLITENTVSGLEILYKSACMELESFSVGELDIDRNFWKFNSQIHYCFFDAYNNTVFKEILRGLWDRLTSVQLLEFYDKSRIVAVMQEHKEILSALKARNLIALQNAIEKHLLVSRDNMRKELEKHKPEL